MTLDQDSIVTIFVVGYFAVFCAFMLSEKFRRTFADWLTLKDPLGIQFWATNPVFTIITLAVFILSAIIIAT